MRTRATRLASRWPLLAALAILVVVVVIAATVIVSVLRPARPIPSTALPLRPIGQIPLPGDSSRFDYASLDAQRGLLFIAHLGASEIVEVDLHARRVLRTIPGINQVHGVLVVPRSQVARALTASAARTEKEAVNRAAFQRGELGLDRYGMRDELAGFGIEYVSYDLWADAQQ